LTIIVNLNYTRLAKIQLYLEHFDNQYQTTTAAENQAALTTKEI